MFCLNCFRLKKAISAVWHLWSSLSSHCNLFQILFWHWEAAALPTKSFRLLSSKFVGLRGVGVLGHLLANIGSAAAWNRKRGPLNYWRNWRSVCLQYPFGGRSSYTNIYLCGILMFCLKCFRLEKAISAVWHLWTSLSSQCNLFQIIFGTDKLQLFQPNHLGYFLLNL
jgi:hypothetical protein